MNIVSTLEIYAGGVGSGPNAPCPQCGPHSFKEGDKVKVKDGATITHPKVGSKFTFNPGTIAMVTNVLPKVGNAEQMVAVQSEQDQGEGKYGNQGYAKMSDLTMHQPKHVESPYAPVSKMTKSGTLIPKFDKYGKVIAPDPHAIQIKKVPESQTVMHTTTADGASLTWVKSHETSEKEAQDITSKDHSLKGKFELQTTVPAYGNVKENKTTRLYDTGGDNKGATVWVSGTTKGGKITGVNIREQNYSTYGQKTEAAFNFHYKNAAAAVGMLKSRYGIVTSLKRLRGGA